jgi:hypothetical protein
MTNARAWSFRDPVAELALHCLGWRRVWTGQGRLSLSSNGRGVGRLVDEDWSTGVQQIETKTLVTTAERSLCR